MSDRSSLHTLLLARELHGLGIILPKLVQAQFAVSLRHLPISRFEDHVLSHLRNLPNAFQRLELHLQLAFAGLAALVLFAFILSLLPKPAPDHRLLEDYGSILAEQLAGLTVESIVKQDRIALNVLAERIAQTEAVAGVAVFGVDGQRLAGYGNFAEQQPFEFTEPVVIDDAYAGYARIVLEPDALATTDNFNQLAPWIAASLVTCITLGLLIVWLTHVPLHAAKIGALGSPSTPAITAEANTPGAYLLVVNLFNQHDLNNEIRDEIVAACETDIRAVADLYGADWLSLPGTGFALSISQRPAQDHAFEAACAALVLAKLCGKNAPHPLLAPKFRFSLQPLVLHQGQLNAHSYSDELADAVLRSAVADDATIALSTPFFDKLAEPERLALTHEHNPALAALRGDDDTDYYLLSQATGNLAELIEHQVRSLT